MNGRGRGVYKQKKAVILTEKLLNPKIYALLIFSKALHWATLEYLLVQFWPTGLVFDTLGIKARLEKEVKKSVLDFWLIVTLI